MGFVPPGGDRYLIAMGMTELLVLGAALLVLGLPLLGGLAGRGGASGYVRWALMFAMGAGIGLVRFLADPYQSLGFGLGAVAVFGVMSATRSSPRAFTAPVWFVLAYLLPLFIAEALYAVFVMPGEGFMVVWLWPSTWWYTLLDIPSNPGGAAGAALLVGVGYLLLERNAPAGSWAGAGHGGLSMKGGNQEVTRLALASAVLDGALFRRKVLQRARDRYRAVAPEPGVDLSLVLRMCVAEERRARGFRIAYLLLVLALLVLYGIGAPGLGALIVLGVIGLRVYQQGVRRFRLIPRLAQGRFDPEEWDRTLPPLPDDLRDGVPRADQNVVVYSGFSPFGSAGFDLGGWSFALDVSRPRDDLPEGTRPLPVEIPALYEAIENGIVELGLGSLESRDHYFVHGTDVRRFPSILNHRFSRPLQRVAPEDLLQDGPLEVGLRRYKWLRLYDWGGELVVSYAFRGALQGSNLFVEVARFLLTPVSESHRKVDTQPEPTFMGNLQWLLGTALFSPVAAAWNALVLLWELGEGIHERLGFADRNARKRIRNDPAFDYGVKESLRRSLMSSSFQHYFQKIDGEMYMKTLDRQVLDSIVDYLAARNVDTSAVRERQSTILNNGIMIQSGNVTAQSLAVGAQASAGVVERITQGVRRESSKPAQQARSA